MYITCNTSKPHFEHKIYFCPIKFRFFYSIMPILSRNNSFCKTKVLLCNKYFNAVKTGLFLKQKSNQYYAWQQLTAIPQDINLPLIHK